MGLDQDFSQGDDRFWNKKVDTSPLGVPLGDLAALLAPTSIKAEIKGNVLLARHEHYAVRIEVVPPENRESENGPIQAVVRMTTALPKPFMALFQNKADSCATFNTFAALGALTSDGADVFIGSRLTLYDGANAWRSLHVPLLLFTITGGSEALLGAIRRALSDEGNRSGVSKWTERDLAQVEGFLSRLCVCTTGGLGLTAEFGLKADAISAVAGDQGSVCPRPVPRSAGVPGTDSPA
jgi:hypothetical protein